MNVPASGWLIAVDVGNSRVKFGRFPNGDGDALPEPIDTLDISLGRGLDVGLLPPWLAPAPQGSCHWRLASVNRATCRQLIDWLGVMRPADSWQELTWESLPLTVGVPQPQSVGIDRLLGAVAANQLRLLGKAAVVIDLGTAITVDWISAEGIFLGGAILPGIGMSTRALAEQTDLLPNVEMAELADPPAALGTSTVDAIRSGLFWGTVGAIRELTERLGADQPDAMLLLTGGAAPTVAPLIHASAVYLPHLVLSGLAVASRTRIP